MSIRARMSLWYVLLLALVLAAFNIIIYVTLSNSLYNNVDEIITARADQVARAISQVVALRSDPTSYLLRERIVLPSIDVFASPGLYVQVLTVDGQLVAKSDNLGDQFLPLSQQQLAQVIASSEPLLQTTTARQAPLRTISTPILLDDSLLGVVQVARSLQEVADTLRQLRTLLLIGSGIGLLLALVGGSILAKRALAPVDNLTRTAQGIVDAQDLSQRVPHRGPQDEVGRLTSTLNRMLARIEDLFLSQRRFIADISHELRTPLTTIRGYVELLQRDGACDDPQERRQVLAIIQDEISRMSRMAADLVLLAQADAGVSLGHEPVELDTLLLEVYGQARAWSKPIRLSIGQEDQALVRGDRDRLKQLLLNLLDNAFKYTPDGGQVKLSLSRQTTADGREWARLTVADSGIGIPAEELPHIFERFYRVDKARSRAQGGTGLGLSIAQWIAEAHGGYITVASQINQGSTFVVWLPLLPEV